MSKHADGVPIWFYILMMGVLIFVGFKAFVEPWIIDELCKNIIDCNRSDS